jgi:phosphoribosylformylglycinamidine synthase
MIAPKVLILSGYGLNCEEETLTAFEESGATGKVVHINDLIDGLDSLQHYQILAIPGGFSYGDDTGSGNAYANKFRHSLWEQLLSFVQRDTLAIGICNGCQIAANLGIVPAISGAWGERKVALVHNSTAQYQCRWVDLAVHSTSPWLQGIEKMHIPVAHGEGKFAMDADTHRTLKEKGMIGLQYVTPDGSPANGVFPYNPNGALDDIAGIIDESGRILALMPHPERGMFFSQRDDWSLLAQEYIRQGKELPKYSDGIKIFQNAVKYFV